MTRINENKLKEENFSYLSGQNSLLWGWWDSGTGCPEKLWVPQPGQCSRASFIRPWATCSSGKRPCQGQGRGDGTRWSLRPLPILNRLWLYTLCKMGRGREGIERKREEFPGAVLIATLPALKSHFLKCIQRLFLPPHLCTKLNRQMAAAPAGRPGSATCRPRRAAPPAARDGQRYLPAATSSATCRPPRAALPAGEAGVRGWGRPGLGGGPGRCRGDARRCLGSPGRRLSAVRAALCRKSATIVPSSAAGPAEGLAPAAQLESVRCLSSAVLPLSPRLSPGCCHTPFIHLFFLKLFVVRTRGRQSRELRGEWQGKSERLQGQQGWGGHRWPCVQGGCDNKRQRLSAP